MRDMSEHKKASGKKDAAKLKKCKPLEGRAVFLDLVGRKKYISFEKRLKLLGADVEKCFSRDVQFLITNRQSSAELQRWLKDGLQSPTSMASPSPASPGLFRVTQASGVFDSSPALPSPADNAASLVATRGQAIAQKANLTKSYGSTNVLDCARQWGIKIIHVSKADRWMNKELDKLPKPSTEKPHHKSRIERLGSCYIKVDDVKQHHCPLYKSFSIPPAIHISQPFGVSIFTPSAPRNDEQHQLLHTRELLQPKTKEPDCWHGEAYITAAERVKLASRGSVRTAVAGAVGRKHVDCHPRQVEVVKANQHVSSKKGFCEICKINFSDMKMHCQSRAHQALATDAKFYQSLDELIADGLELTVDKFLPSQSTEADLSMQPSISNSIADETAQAESSLGSGQDFNNLCINEDETVNMLSPLCHTQFATDDCVDASVSSEIPITTPPLTWASIELEKRTEIPAKIICDGNPVTYAQDSLSNIAVDTYCNADTLTASGGQSLNVTGKACKVSTSISCLPLLSIPCSAVVATNVASAFAGLNSSSLSPPKLTSFWDELDILSGRSGVMAEDLFTINVDDDPPFVGFGSDLEYERLSHHLSPVVSDGDCSSGMVNADDDVPFHHRQSKDHQSIVKPQDEVLHQAVTEAVVGTSELHDKGRSQSQQRMPSVGQSFERTGKTCKVSVSSVCLPALSTIRTVEVAAGCNTEVASAGDRQNSSNESHCISSKWIVDDDVEFNHFSPQKHYGIVSSHDTGKLVSPSHRTPWPKANSRLRKRLFASKVCSQVPPSGDQSMSQTPASPAGKLRRRGNQKS